MKIVCDNCGAKYSIADEKVAGKNFKIRCKKCSAMINVRGDQAASDEDEATRVVDYGAEAAWHVVVQGDQQGPFAPLQLGAMLTDGKIDWEAYVWKEGFDGWKPLREVAELVEALNGASSSSPLSTEESVESDDPKTTADQPAADEAPTAVAAPAAAAAAPAAAAASKAGADLFAGSDTSDSSFGSDADDQDVVASQPSPRVSMPQASLTGQRNENSVLFSLQNLQSLATTNEPAQKASSPTSGPASSAGHALGDGSGLIDIRALASAASSSKSSGASSGASANAGIDDLLSLGAGSALGGGLGAPVLTPAVEKEESKPNLAILYGLVGLLAVGLIGAVGYLLTREPQQIVVTQEVPSAAPPPATGGAAAPTTVAPTPEPPAGETTVAAGNTEEAEPSRNEERDRRPSTNRTSSTSTAMTTTAPSTGTTAPTTTAMAPAPSRSGDSLDALMGEVTGMSGSTTTMAASNLPEQPSRDAVRSALGGRAGAVSACGGTGTAMAAVTFSSSGSVSRVNVTGAGDAASCVSAAVRGARVPPFSRPSFSVSFPYRL